MNKIILDNLKAIRHLEFELPNQNGVYLITGKNGTGKTNLLVSLYRICHSEAFPENFPTGANNFDDVNRYQITYICNSSQVCYYHTNQRWNPHPKSNATILSGFGYADTIYVSASKMRFDAHTPAELKRQRIVKHNVSPDFKNTMNQILGTTKFNNLKYIQLSNQGRPGRQIRHNNKLYIIDGHNYSENTFSLGERFVLNMLDQLEGVQNNSLIIIDEIELALHPIAQLSFFDFLKDLSARKNITVIIATHSSTLIKNSTNTFYLENNNGNISVLKNCKPSYILSGISSPIDNNYDKLFLVEDPMAKLCLESMLKKHYSQTKQLLNYQVLYVGGWPEVIRFLKQMNGILPYKPNMVFAYLDKDAEDSLNVLSMTPNLNEGQQKDLNDYKSVIQYVSFLHITPEIGIWEWLVNNESLFVEQWRKKTNNALFTLYTSIESIDINHKHARSSKVCKECISELCKEMIYTPFFPDSVCRSFIVDLYYENAVFCDGSLWPKIDRQLYSQLNL